MTKKEFIEKFELTKDKKMRIEDGRRTIERVLYVNPYGSHFCFYGNDLYYVKMCGDYGCLGAGYSWYQ